MTIQAKATCTTGKLLQIPQIPLWLELTAAQQTSRLLDNVLALPNRLPHVAHLTPRPLLAPPLSPDATIPHPRPKRRRLRHLHNKPPHNPGLLHLHPQPNVLVLPLGESQRAIPAVYSEPIVGAAVAGGAGDAPDDKESVGDVDSECVDLC